MHLDLATILLVHPLSLAIGAFCFLWLRWRSRRTRGLGKLASAFLVLASGSLLAGAGEQGVVDYGTWTFVTTVTIPFAYALIFFGLLNLMSERPIGRFWWVLLIPVVIALVAVVAPFHLNKFYRAMVFLTSMGGFALACAALVLWDPQKERLESRFGLVAVFGFKALLAFSTIGGIITPEIVRLTTAATFLVLILCQFVVAMFVLMLVQERAEKRLIALTETDSLTGIRNRHWMMDRLPRMTSVGSAVVIIDIDHFKQINDRYGHAAGDQVLIVVAQSLVGALGEDAIFARMGGEEFGLFLPKTSDADAIATGEILRQTVEALSVSQEGVVIPVTLSAGVAVARGEMSITRLVGRADEALYVAKRAGRNRVHLLALDAAPSPQSERTGADAGALAAKFA